MAERKKNGAAEKDAAPSKPAPANTLKFDYIKSTLFRVVHGDGVWGGSASPEQIYMAFFSERPPIPTQATYELLPGGRLGEEIKEKREARDAIIREIEVAVVVNLDTAKAVVGWLQDKIEAIEKAKAERHEPEKGKAE